MKQLFKRKQLDYDTLHNNELDRVIGPWQLTQMGIGAIVGAGIFITPGIIAATTAGPSVVLSYVIAAIVCSLAALCYAEFASTIPIAGSAYTYIYAMFGELPGWLIGWSLVSEYLFAVSSVAVSWSAYFQSLIAGFGLHLPTYLTISSGSSGHKGFGIDITAGIVILIIGFLLSNGMNESAKLNAAMVVIKILVILLFVVVAAFYVKPTNFHPFMPHGFHGTFQGASIAFYAYLGFDAVSSAAAETKNPQKTMPKGIIGSLIVATILYVLVSLVMVGSVSYTRLNVNDPVAFVLHVINQNWAAGIISLGAIIGMTTVILVMSYGGTRLLFAMSHDGLLPKTFSKINQHTKVPIKGTWIFTLIAAAIAMFVPLSTITELVNVGTLLAFASVSLGIIFLRKHQELKGQAAFKVPFYPILPIISLLACLSLLFNLKPLTWIIYAIWIVLGLTVYGLYGYKHSKVQKND